MWCTQGCKNINHCDIVLKYYMLFNKQFVQNHCFVKTNLTVYIWNIDQTNIILIEKYEDGTQCDNPTQLRSEI